MCCQVLKILKSCQNKSGWLLVSFLRKEKFCTRLEKLENQGAKLEKLELEKLENDLERTLAKIARSNPVYGGSCCLKMQ